MTLLPKAPVALLRLDAIQIQRPSASTGANPTVSYPQVFDGRGTLGAPNQREYMYSADTDPVTVVDQTLSLEAGIDLRVNDRVLTARGTFTVVSIASHRLHQRAFLRRVG